jgi:hypothetical protein
VNGVQRLLVLTLMCTACLGTLRAIRAEDTAPETSPRIYLIGNSLTWDTQPSRLSGDVQWHVDCGKSLPYIFANPAQPCVKSSTLWPQALRAKKYDMISVQSHYGATLAQDVETISKWVDLQPQAVFVVHTGWARSATRAEEYAQKEVPTDRSMQHSRVYIATLLAELQKQHPKTVFRQTHAIELLDQVARDVAAGTAPIPSVDALYRDKIHMKLDSGRYLMHNAMRHALGQPIANAGFEKLDPATKAYLDKVLKTLPENEPENEPKPKSKRAN